MAASINNKETKGHAPVSELFQPAILGFTSKEVESTQRSKFSLKDYIPIEENT